MRYAIAREPAAALGDGRRPSNIGGVDSERYKASSGAAASRRDHGAAPTSPASRMAERVTDKYGLKCPPGVTEKNAA